MDIRLVRTHDGVSHLKLIGEIGNLHLTQQAHGITFEARLVDDSRILQHLALETDSTQQSALLTLGGMILEVLTQVTLVASLSDGITHGRQFHLLQMFQFGYQLIVAFL